MPTTTPQFELDPELCETVSQTLRSLRITYLSRANDATEPERAAYHRMTATNLAAALSLVQAAHRVRLANDVMTLALRRVLPAPVAPAETVTPLGAKCQEGNGEGE